MKSQVAAAQAKWWDWLSAGLMLIGLLAVAGRLAATQWTDHLQMAYALAVFGLAAGLALGQSQFRLRTTLLFAAIFGLFVLGWQIGATVAPRSEWMTKILTIADRLAVSAQQFARQEPVQDPLLALILFAALFWVMSLQAGYALTKHADAWQATLPGGLALLVIHTYDYRPAGPQFNLLLWSVSVYFLTSLLLVARLNYVRRRRGWQMERVSFSPEVGTDILQATAVATVVLVVIAWAAPLTPSVLPPARDIWTVAARPFNDVRTRFGNLFTSLRASFGVVQDNYSDSLPLGRGNALDDTPIMQVDAPSPGASGPRYYWRAWAYDTFSSGRWKNTFTQIDNLSPEAFDEVLPVYKSQWTGEFSITPDVPLGLLYAPSHATWVNRAVRAVVAKDDAGKADLVSIQSAVTVFPGDTYRVRASYSTATISQLRQASGTYPAWITAHYLQIPALTDRTRTLAKSITSQSQNAYDKAEAITEWLRQNIKYADTVPQVPSSQDVIDWFLFDLKQGFCNYYASAEVVLLRSVGVPARMAVGYARGEETVAEDALRPGDLPPNISNSGLATKITYTVRQRDAHAWPEVYFPEYGWVEFEPTVSQAPIARALGGPAADTGPVPTAAPVPANPQPVPTRRPVGEDELTNNTGSSLNQNATLVWAAGVIVAGLIIVLLWRARARFSLPSLVLNAEKGIRRLGLTPPQALQNWARAAELGPVALSYQEVNYALKRLSATPDISDTPSDRVARLTKLLPECSPWAVSLLSEYHRESYGVGTANIPLAQQAGRFIRNSAWRRFIYVKLNGADGTDSGNRFSSWRRG